MHVDEPLEIGVGFQEAPILRVEPEMKFSPSVERSMLYSLPESGPWAHSHLCPNGSTEVRKVFFFFLDQAHFSQYKISRILRIKGEFSSIGADETF